MIAARRAKSAKRQKLYKNRLKARLEPTPLDFAPKPAASGLMDHASPTDTDTLHRRGLLFILSSPSGAGKTTLSRKLLEADNSIELSVSATTRAPRPGETDGVHYHFVSDAQFDQMIEGDDFYEWAEVFGNRYGTPKSHIRDGLKVGNDYLFDIDWQGTQQLKQKDDQDVVTVFVLPPSLDELRRRLESRAQDSAEVIDARMERAKEEISHWAEYKYVVINDDIDECFAKVREILHAERMLRKRQTGMIPFVRQLMT